MNLRTIRRLKDITQVQLAEMAGVEPSTISDIERGKNRNPSFDTVLRLSQALGLRPDEMADVFTPREGTK